MPLYTYIIFISNFNIKYISINYKSIYLNYINMKYKFYLRIIYIKKIQGFILILYIFLKEGKKYIIRFLFQNKCFELPLVTSLLCVTFSISTPHLLTNSKYYFSYFNLCYLRTLKMDFNSLGNNFMGYVRMECSNLHYNIQFV